MAQLQLVHSLRLFSELLSCMRACATVRSYTLCIERMSTYDDSSGACLHLSAVSSPARPEEYHGIEHFRFYMASLQNVWNAEANHRHRSNKIKLFYCAFTEFSNWVSHTQNIFYLDRIFLPENDLLSHLSCRNSYLCTYRRSVY